MTATQHAHSAPDDPGTDQDDDIGEGNLRRCVVTRESFALTDLIRFVRAPDGTLVADLEQRLPGRGAWALCHRGTVEKAIKTNAFARSLKAQAVAPADLPDRIEYLLRQRLIAAISLANKAGHVVAGFQQVDAALDKGALAILVHGQDAAEDGRGKLDRKFRAIARDGGPEARIFDILTISELGLAMGRPYVVHAGLTPGGLAERFSREAERVARYGAPSAVPGAGNPGVAAPGAETSVAPLSTTTAEATNATDVTNDD